MSTENRVEVDIASVVAVIVVFLLIVLCVGTPDLLDAIIAWVNRQ